MNDIKVSIIIPVYNVEKYLEECLCSVINQTLKEIEIICVNDGSTDNSLKILQNFAQKDKRIVVIDKKNGGLSSARNTGLKIAKGQYIFNLDSDDFLKKETLEKCYNYAQKNKLDVVIFDINTYDDNLKKVIKIWKDSDFKEDKIYTSKDYLIQYFCGNGCGSVCNKLWKKDLYIKNNILHPENVSNGEDASTSPRLIINSKKIGKISNSFLFYRQREKSLTKNTSKISDIKQAYYIPLNYLKEKKVEYLSEYEFSYKWNHYYCNILSYKKNSSIILKNTGYKILYEELLKDLKNKENKLIFYNNNFKTTIKDFIFNKIYKKSIFLGELIRNLIIDITNLKIKLKGGK